MKNVINFVFWLFCFSSCNMSDKSVNIWSPDGQLCISLSINGEDQRLFYKVFYGGDEIICASSFGIIKDNIDLGKNIQFGYPKMYSKQDHFFMLGNHPEVDLEYTEMVLPVNSNGEEYDLIVRAYNKGMAVRSVLYNKGNNFINGENTEWNLPNDAVIWYQTDCHSYEGLFTQEKLDTLIQDMTLALPVTVQLKEKKRYLLLTEANVVNYSDMALKVSTGHTLKSFFHANPEGWNIIENQEQPWRVVLVADNLNQLVNNDVIYSLADSAQVDLNKAWIKPGRATWQWWSSGNPILLEQKKWIDWTAELGFEYYLIDDGWKMWRKGKKNEWDCLKEVVEEAQKKGIGIWLWVHSAEVDTSEKRIAYFEKVKETGIVGVKIDFMPPASVQWINWYEETLKDAAKLELMIDFHGAVKPSGRNRTWPHEMTREAIRGHEWHILRYNRTLPASHDCILPFNRCIQGFADYTPTVLNPKELRGFTWSREIAQAIIFASPFLCYADRPDFYLQNEATELIKKIPAIWDETQVLPGSEIGECVVFARCKDKVWYLAVINGDYNRLLTINLSFLDKNKAYRFDAFEDAENIDSCLIRKTKIVNCNDSINLELKAKGGFVGVLSFIDKE